MKCTCPTCRREFERNDTGFFPFCSDRCQLIDLGRWAGGDYRIAGPPVGPESLDLADNEEKGPEDQASRKRKR